MYLTDPPTRRLLGEGTREEPDKGGEQPGKAREKPTKGMEQSTKAGEKPHKGGEKPHKGSTSPGRQYSERDDDEHDDDAQTEPDRHRGPGRAPVEPRLIHCPTWPGRWASVGGQHNTYIHGGTGSTHTC